MGHLIRLFVGLTLIVALTAGPAAAERRDWRNDKPSPPVIRWLMSEPVSLLDWGLMRLERHLRQAGAVLLARRASEGPTIAGAAYSRRTQQITGYLSIATPRDERSRIRCAELHHRVARLITSGVPDGVAPASWYVQNLFSPNARPWLRPDRRNAKALMALVRLEVILRDVDYDKFDSDHTRVTCTGPLDAEPQALSYRSTS